MDTLFQELDPPTQASGYSGRGSPSGYPPPFFFFSASSSVPMLESGGGWRRGLVLVYDLGGGTFDVSVLEDENDLFEVLATGGDTHLGGGDFDQRVMDYFINLIKRKYQVDISGEKKAMGKLRRE
ncbi:Heat shock 70 kDa protein BIP3 [Linum perenne]